MAADCPPTSKATSAWLNLTGCPSSHWQEVVAGAVPRTAPIHFVNVGANKGYSLVEFLGLWSQHHVTPHAWGRKIYWYAKQRKFKYLAQTGCGYCWDCKARAIGKHQRTGGRAIALELVANNRAMVRTLARETGLAASLAVHDFAASNVRRPTWFSILSRLWALPACSLMQAVADAHALLLNKRSPDRRPPP